MLFKLCVKLAHMFFCFSLSVVTVFRVSEIKEAKVSFQWCKIIRLWAQEGLLATQKLITYHLNSLQKGTTTDKSLTSSPHKEALAECYLLQGNNQHCLGHFSEAFTSQKHALTIILELFGEEHVKTADVYSELGFKKYKLGDYISAAEFYKLALDIRIQLLGEEHEKTAESYH